MAATHVPMTMDEFAGTISNGLSRVVHLQR